MIGALKFREYGFEIEQVNKGKDTWKKFLTLMKNEEYTKATDYTREEG